MLVIIGIEKLYVFVWDGDDGLSRCVKESINEVASLIFYLNLLITICHSTTEPRSENVRNICHWKKKQTAFNQSLAKLFKLNFILLFRIF